MCFFLTSKEIVIFVFIAQKKVPAVVVVILFVVDPDVSAFGTLLFLFPQFNQVFGKQRFGIHGILRD